MYKLDNSGPGDFFETKKSGSEETSRVEESQADVKEKIENAIMVDLNNNEGKQSSAKELNEDSNALKMEKVDVKVAEESGATSHTSSSSINDSLTKDSEKAENSKSDSNNKSIHIGYAQMGADVTNSANEPSS